MDLFSIFLTALSLSIFSLFGLRPVPLETRHSKYCKPAARNARGPLGPSSLSWLLAVDDIRNSEPALFMSTSAAIADPLLRRAFGQRARPSDPPRTIGDWRLSFCACPRLGAGQAPPQTAEPVPWAPRAGLATRLRDFATNRHEQCGL